MIWRHIQEDLNLCEQSMRFLGGEVLVSEQPVQLPVLGSGIS